VVGDAEAERLKAIDRALVKMAEGRYGVSELSGEPIGCERLSVEPWAQLTVAEAQAIEVAQGHPKHSTL
jgi:DnaK suppressor protein